jgi:hypothetical protein
MVELFYEPWWNSWFLSTSSERSSPSLNSSVISADLLVLMIFDSELWFFSLTKFFLFRVSCYKNLFSRSYFNFGEVFSNFGFLTIYSPKCSLTILSHYLIIALGGLDPSGNSSSVILIPYSVIIYSLYVFSQVLTSRSHLLCFKSYLEEILVR